MNWLVFSVVLLPILALLAWLAWDVLIRSKNPPVKINLYRRVNNAYFWDKTFKAEVKSDKVLGNFLVSKRRKFKMSEPSADDFVPSKRLNVLNVAMFGIDDFRPIKFLKGVSFYSKEEVPVWDVVEEVDEESGESHSIRKPKLDKSGGVVTEFVEREFVEPIAVSQSDKEVVRFNRDYHRRMDELRRSKEGFWKQNAPMVISGTIVAICLLMMVMFVRVDSKSDLEVQKYYIDAFGNYADELLTEMKSPNYFQRIMENVNAQKVEEAAPIS